MVIFSNSFDLHESSVIRVFEVHKFESCVKIKVGPFLVDLVGLYFCRKFFHNLKTVGRTASATSLSFSLFSFT